MKSSAVNVSIGTAAVLGLAEVKMADAPTTAYLMLGGRCLMNCAFCAQARDSQADELALSRVTWPEYPLDLVVDRLVQAVDRGEILRTCLQVTATEGAFGQALAVLRAIKIRCDVPFDVAILPKSLHQVRHLIESGADHIGFGLDAASERVFHRVKGRDWARALALIEATARSFPGRAALHLIVGLGESEREMVERIQWAHERGITVGLFAFTPVRGSAMQDLPPPPLAAYRRMQVARWLVVNGQARLEGMAFDAGGRLVAVAASLPANGEPFRTSGCPDCNRPYYNERPGGVMYNYPRPLTSLESVQAVRATEMEGLPAGSLPDQCSR